MIAVIALIAVIIGVASAMTYAAGKLGSAIPEFRKLHTSNNELSELLEQNTEAKNEQNRLIEQYTAEQKETNSHLSEQTELREKIEAHLADLQSKMEELQEHMRNNPIAHAPAD